MMKNYRVMIPELRMKVVMGQVTRLFRTLALMTLLMMVF